MYRRKPAALLILFGFPLFFCHGQASHKTGLSKAWIELQSEENTTFVRGIYINNSLTLEKLTYRLSMEKRGKSGTSQSTQSGTFSAVPGNKVLLSQTEMSLSPKDHYNIVLSVRDFEGQVVAGDTIEFNGR